MNTIVGEARDCGRSREQRIPGETREGSWDNEDTQDSGRRYCGPGQMIAPFLSHTEEADSWRKETTDDCGLEQRLWEKLGEIRGL